MSCSSEFCDSSWVLVVFQKVEARRRRGAPGGEAGGPRKKTLRRKRSTKEGETPFSFSFSSKSRVAAALEEALTRPAWLWLEGFSRQSSVIDAPGVSGRVGDGSRGGPCSCPPARVREHRPGTTAPSLSVRLPLERCNYSQLGLSRPSAAACVSVGRLICKCRFVYGHCCVVAFIKHTCHFT